MLQHKRLLALMFTVVVASALIFQQLSNISIVIGSIEKVTWKTFKDSADIFTIQYPSKWEPRNAPDPLGPIDVEFWYYGNTSSSPDTYAYVDVVAWRNFQYYNSTQEMIKNDQLTMETEAEDFKIEQAPECNSYVINQVQGCSHIYSLSFPGQPYWRNALFVDAVDNRTGIQYQLALVASQDVFEQFKPVFDHMVNSFTLNSDTFAG
jgi:hypothetical protein